MRLVPRLAHSGKLDRSAPAGCIAEGSAALSFAMKLLVTLLKYVPASVLYPIQNSAILVLLVLLSAVHLKEKIGKYTRIGIAFALTDIAALGL